MRRLPAVAALTVATLLIPAALPGPLVPAYAATGPSPVEVTAVYETPALFDDEAGGDADADDPAIWIHPTEKRHSLIIGTAKNGGLRVYDLRGRELQAIATPPAPGPDDAAGRFNNVDLVSGVPAGRSPGGPRRGQ